MHVHARIVESREDRRITTHASRDSRSIDHLLKVFQDGTLFIQRRSSVPPGMYSLTTMTSSDFRHCSTCTTCYRSSLDITCIFCVMKTVHVLKSMRHLIHIHTNIYSACIHSHSCRRHTYIQIPRLRTWRRHLNMAMFWCVRVHVYVYVYVCILSIIS